MLKKLLLAVVLAIIICCGILSLPAASQQVEFRVNNLESNLRRLELRFNQIELLLRQNSQIPSSRTTQTPTQSRSSGRNLLASERDKMFDRLATLVIELKQQVNDLEKRVQKLESGK